MAEESRKSNMEKAEGDRDTALVNSDTSEGTRGDTDAAEDTSRRSEWGEGTSQGGGITNRPIGEEIANQEEVPERGDRKGGAHAG